MGEAIIAAVITGCISLFGMVVTLRKSANEQSQEIATQIALMKQDINHLTQTVSVHNNYASRMPVVEQKIDALEARMKVLETRFNDMKREA